MKQECSSVFKVIVKDTKNISYTVRYGLGFLEIDKMSFLQVQALKAKTRDRTGFVTNIYRSLV